MSSDHQPIMRDAESYDTDHDGSSDDEMLLPPPADDAGRSYEDPDSQNMSLSINAPKDRFSMIYIIFIIQGIGMLLPWNFFITAKDYFDYKFREDKNIQEKVENSFALAAMFPNLISLSVNIYLTNKLSRSCRVSTCLFIMFSMFILTTVFVKINTDHWAQKLFVITLVCIIFMNTASGIYQGTLFGVAGIVGERYTQAIMTGQGLAGIFAALADLIFKLSNPNSKDPTSSAFGYFLTAAVVIFITGVTYTLLFKLPRMQFYFNRFERHANKKDAISVQKVAQTKLSIPYFLIFKQIMPLAFSVMFVFCVTLSLFPAVISKIESVDKASGSRVTNDLFSNLVCFLLFNVGDLCGRMIAGPVQIVKERSPWLLILCISRVIFIPLFLMCNFGHSSPLPYVFTHDAWPIVFICLFSVSNGYLGSLCMMYGPRLVAIEYSETAGTMMSFFLTCGLTMGACISFAFKV